MNIKSLPRDKIPISPLKPLPIEDVPMWTKLPYDTKYPLPPCSEKVFTLTREELGKSLYQTFPGKEFDLTQSPVPFLKGSTYNSLHDPFLYSFFRSSSRLKNLMRNGLVTKDGKVKCGLQEYNHYRMYLYHLWVMQVNQLTKIQTSQEKSRFKNIFKAQDFQDPLFNDVTNKCERVNIEKILHEVLSRMFQDKKEFIAEHGLSPSVRSAIQWKLYQQRLKKNFKNNYPAVKLWLCDRSKHYRHLMEKKINARLSRDREMRSQWNRICERSRARFEKELKLRECQRNRMRMLSEQRYNRAKNQWAKNEREIKLRRKKLRQPFTNLGISDDLRLDKVKISEAELGSFSGFKTTELGSKAFDEIDLNLARNETEDLTESDFYHSFSNPTPTRIYQNQKTTVDSPQEKMTRDGSHSKKQVFYSDTDLYTDVSEKKISKESKTRQLPYCDPSIKMLKCSENNISSNSIKDSFKMKMHKVGLHYKDESQTDSAVKKIPQSENNEKSEIKKQGGSQVNLNRLEQKSKGRSKIVRDQDSDSSDDLITSEKNKCKKQTNQLKTKPKTNQKKKDKVTATKNEMTSNKIENLLKGIHPLAGDNSREINYGFLKKSYEKNEFLDKSEKLARKDNTGNQSLSKTKAKEYSFSLNSQAQLVKLLYGLPNFQELNRTKMDIKEYLPQAGRKDGSSSNEKKATENKKAKKPKEYLPQNGNQDFCSSDEENATDVEKSKKYPPQTEVKDSFALDEKKATDDKKFKEYLPETRTKEGSSLNEKKATDVEKSKKYITQTDIKVGTSFDEEKETDIEKAEKPKEYLPQNGKQNLCSSDEEKATNLEKTKKYLSQTETKDGSSLDEKKGKGVEKSEKYLPLSGMKAGTSSDDKKAADVKKDENSKEYLPQTGRKDSSSSDEEKAADVESSEKDKDPTISRMDTEIKEGKKHRDVWKELETSMEDAQKKVQDRYGLKTDTLLDQRDQRIWRELCQNELYSSTYIHSLRKKQVTFEEVPTVHYLDEIKLKFYRTDSEDESGDESEEEILRRIFGKRKADRKFKNLCFAFDEYKMKKIQSKKTKLEVFSNTSQTKMRFSSEKDEIVRSEYLKSQVHQYRKKQLDLELLELFLPVKKANLRKISKVEKYDIKPRSFNKDGKNLHLQTLNTNTRKDDSSLANETEFTQEPHLTSKVIKSKKKGDNLFPFSKYIKFKDKNMFSIEKTNIVPEVFDRIKSRNLNYSVNHLEKESKSNAARKLKDTSKDENQDQLKKIDYENIMDESIKVTKEPYTLQTNEQTAKVLCEAQNASESRLYNSLEDHLEDQSKVTSEEQREYLLKSKEGSREQEDIKHEPDERSKEANRTQVTDDNKTEQQIKNSHHLDEKRQESMISTSDREFISKLLEIQTTNKIYDTPVGEIKKNDEQEEITVLNESSEKEAVSEEQEEITAIQKNNEKNSYHTSKTIQQEEIDSIEEDRGKYSYKICSISEQEVISNENIAESVLDREMVESFKKIHQPFSKESTNFLYGIYILDPPSKEKTEECVDPFENQELTEAFENSEIDDKLPFVDDPNSLKKGLRRKTEKCKKPTVEKKDLVQSIEVKVFGASDESEHLKTFQPTELISNIESSNIKRSIGNFQNVNYYGKDKNMNTNKMNVRTISYEKGGRDKIRGKHLKNILHNNIIIEKDLPLTFIKSSDLKYTVFDHSNREDFKTQSEYYQIRKDSTMETKDITNDKFSFFDLQQRNASLDSVPNFIYTKKNSCTSLEDDFIQESNLLLAPKFENIVVKNIHSDPDIDSGVDKKHELLDEGVSMLKDDKTSLYTTCPTEGETLYIWDIEDPKIVFEKATQMPFNTIYKSLIASAIKSAVQKDLPLTNHDNELLVTHFKQDMERKFNPYSGERTECLTNKTVNFRKKSVNDQFIRYNKGTYLNLDSKYSLSDNDLEPPVSNSKSANVNESLVNAILKDIIEETFSNEYISKVNQRIIRQNSHFVAQIKLSRVDQKDFDKSDLAVQKNTLEERWKNKDLYEKFRDESESNKKNSEWNMLLSDEKEASDHSFKSITDTPQKERIIGENEHCYLKLPAQNLYKKKSKQNNFYFPCKIKNIKNKKKHFIQKIIKPLRKQNNKSNYKLFEYTINKKSDIIIIDDVKIFTNCPIDSENKDQEGKEMLRDKKPDKTSTNSEKDFENTTFNAYSEESNSYKIPKSNTMEANLTKNSQTWLNNAKIINMASESIQKIEDYFKEV